MLNIDEAVGYLSDNLPLIKSFHTTTRSRLTDLLQSITTVLDLHATNDGSTAASAHLTLHHSVDRHLDTLRHYRAQLPHLLAQLVAEDGDYGGELEGLDFVYVYMQQVGFLVRMSGAESERWEEGDWLFEDGGYDFYKSERCRQLDEGRLTHSRHDCTTTQVLLVVLLTSRSCLMCAAYAEVGDVDSVIKDVEDSLVRDLQSRVQQQAAAITALAQRTYELDCYMALASAARDMHLTRPQLSDDSVLHITRGRHLLQEKFVDPFIPNDTVMGELGKPGGQVHIITGPNRVSQHSTYIKAQTTVQVAVVVADESLYRSCAETVRQERVHGAGRTDSVPRSVRLVRARSVGCGRASRRHLQLRVGGGQRHQRHVQLLPRVCPHGVHAAPLHRPKPLSH